MRSGSQSASLIPGHGVRLVALCLPGSQKLSERFPEGVYSLSPGGRLSQNEMKQGEAVPFPLMIT